MASNEDLTKKYNDVNDRYTENQYLKFVYNALNETIESFQETGGAVMALHYDFYEGGPSNNLKNYLEATVYNVGDERGYGYYQVSDYKQFEQRKRANVP